MKKENKINIDVDLFEMILLKRLHQLAFILKPSKRINEFYEIELKTKQ